MKYIAKAMKGFDGSFKFSQLNKAKLKAALEERFAMTSFGVSSQDSEWVTMRKREYIRRAFARIPSGITDKVEGRIEVFISGMLNKVTTQTSSELGKKTLTEVGEQNVSASDTVAAASFTSILRLFTPSSPPPHPLSLPPVPPPHRHF